MLKNYGVRKSPAATESHAACNKAIAPIKQHATGVSPLDTPRGDGLRDRGYRLHCRLSVVSRFISHRVAIDDTIQSRASTKTGEKGWLIFAPASFFPIPESEAGNHACAALLFGSMLGLHIG